MKGHGCDSEKPKTLLIGRPFFTKGRPHGTNTLSSTFSGESGNKKPDEAEAILELASTKPLQWLFMGIRNLVCMATDFSVDVHVLKSQ